MATKYVLEMDEEQAVIEAALLLKNYCEQQHWRCCECPFYKHSNGHCLVYGFPHVWKPIEWQEGSK